MTDKEIFEKFMTWIGMKQSEIKIDKDYKIIIFSDFGECDHRFTKMGYEEFYAGAIFDENDKIIKAYIDSHVAYISENCKFIREEYIRHSGLPTKPV